MNIIWTRRLTQLFFLALFFWLAWTAQPGLGTSAERLWPQNLFLYSSPLLALCVWLASGTLIASFVWAFAILGLTLVLGRFFCGWVCPLGTLQQVCSWMVRRGQSVRRAVAMNAFRPAQKIKYLVLLFALASALLSGFVRTLGYWRISLPLFFEGSLQSGLLDPLCLMHRTAQLVVFPLVEVLRGEIRADVRYYSQAAATAMILVTILASSAWYPRIYCRYICPLGALFGVVARWSLWRIGKKKNICAGCTLCERHCEGACSPSDRIRPAECVLCLNCLYACPDDALSYGLAFDPDTVHSSLDISRREFIVSATTGLLITPVIRLSQPYLRSWQPRVLRPPGARREDEFLNLCVRCGQCMKVCPTNIIHPSGWEAGFDALWTPVLNFRMGRSGCVPSCVACSQICPTDALRKISIEERLGIGPFERQGPIRIGLAFVDRSRCLPWAMNRPCIVCQEVCPVSPKAIRLQEELVPAEPRKLRVVRSDELTIEVPPGSLVPNQFSTGDFFVKVDDSRPRRIMSNIECEITIDSLFPFDRPPPPGAEVSILLRLQKPVVVPELCIGCGTCESHCPVQVLRAIRVYAENESRHRERNVLLSSRTEVLA